MTDAARWPILHDVSRSSARAPNEMAGGTPASTWTAEPGALSLLLDTSEIQAMVAEAATWAERIAVCVTAPQSERGTHPWWMEVLARGAKCSSIQVRRAEQTERWLLHRLHESGKLRLVDGGGKNVASNLIAFERGGELRVLLSHIPLDRAVLGAQFGALLAFQGKRDDGIARACRAQVDSWAEHARIPTGSDIDLIAVDPRGKRAPGALELPPGLRPVSDAAELAAGLEVLFGNSSTGASLRAFGGGHRITLEHADASRAPYVLTLHAGAGSAAGNAQLLRAGDAWFLVWRGGLLGHCVSKTALCWSEARLESVLLEAGLGLCERVALIARSGAPVGPQLGAFAQEIDRLCDTFGVEPPPPLGHVLADFESLSAKQRTLLVWRALLGAGALELPAAARLALGALRDMGYRRAETADAASIEAVSALIAEAADARAGKSFDRPSPGLVRAIQRDLSTYTAEDWLECLLKALPEGRVVTRLAAVRLAFEHARSCFGLSYERLRPGGKLERTLERTLASALRRGLCARLGADGIVRLGAAGLGAAALDAARPAEAAASVPDLLTGWKRSVEQLAPMQRFILTRRVGWYGRREALDSVARRLGVTSERARQLEIEGWEQIEAGSSWVAALRSRLRRAFAGASVVPVQRLVQDDAFWHGVDAHLELAEGFFESLLGGSIHGVALGTGAHRAAFFACFDQAALDQALDGLLARAKMIETPAPLDAYAPLCEAAAAELDPAMSEPLRQALEARLELDEREPLVVVGLSASPRAEIEAFPLEPRAVDSEALLRLEDVLRSVFRAAGTPLAFAAVAERVKKRIDVDDVLLAERLPHAPFVRRNADQYGLLARDVPGGSEAIAQVLNDVAQALASGQRGLDAAQIWELARTHVSQAWSPELVRSLVGGDPALYLSASQHTTLRRWEHTRLLPHGTLVCPGVPASMRPRFDRLAQQPAEAAGPLTRRLQNELGRLERSVDSDDVFAAPLARQLCDLASRLITHAEANAEAAPLAHAAVHCLLDALSPDEDDPDAPAADPVALADAHAVFSAVLRWLGLDWLEPS
jgi:hypothetical protein